MIEYYFFYIAKAIIAIANKKMIMI